MENIIYTDADLNAFLVANEEQDGNTIEVVIECDSTGSQSLTITAGLASATEALTPGEKNRVDIPSMLWNFGDDTVITLTKGGSTAGTITIHFPGAIEFDAALNETETDNEFLMQGSATVEQQVVSLQQEVAKASARMLDYILPTAISQTAIADGGNNTVETFEFETTEENVKVSLFTCIQFLATTTVTAGNAYEDLNATITISLDGNAVATILHVYRDGRQLLVLDYLVENISKGNHTVTVNIAAAGGSVSVIQVVSAYMLAAKSVAGGSINVYPLFEDGAWAPEVLPEDVDPQKMTEQAMLNGVETAITKAAQELGKGFAVKIANLSQFYGSSYLLLAGNTYCEPFYTVSDYFRKQGTHGAVTSSTGKPIGSTDGGFCIPIKRASGFTRLSAEMKIVQNNGVFSGEEDGNIARIGVGAIVNNEFVFVSTVEFKELSDWEEKTLDISTLPYVDYLILFGVDGSPGYRNIKLLKS